jgi:Ca-activated chloride channel family protein
MWGKLASTGAVKFQTAREAIRQTLAKVPATTNVGLASFGHRRPGDCSDVEIMLPAEAASVDRILTPLDKLNPKGRGPIVSALRDVAKTMSGPGSIVLVHDDLDNCQQDVCAAARDFAAAQPDLAVHVLSLGMRKEDFARMSCLPKTTGGQHFDIQEASQIPSALDEVFRVATASTVGSGATPRPQPAVRAKQAPVAASQSPTPAPLVGPADDAPVGLYPTALLAAGQPPLQLPTRWALYPVPRGSSPALQETTGANPHLAAQPGRYTLVARSGLVEREAEVEIAASGPTRHAISLDAALLRFASASKGQAPARRLVTIAEPAGDGRTLWIGDAEELTVSPGSYRVSAMRGASPIVRTISASTGARVTVDLGPTPGRLTISASDRDGGTPLEPMLYLVTEDAPDTPTGRREVARSAASQLDVELPPGTYYVTARHGHAEARDTVAIGPAETFRRTLVMPVALLKVTSRLRGGATVPGNDITHRVLRTDDGQRREVARAAGPASDFILPTGRYFVESRLGHQNSVVGADVELSSGQQYRVGIDHQAGEVRLKLVDPTGRLNLVDIHWDVRDASDRSVWRTVQREPQAILAAGRYKVRIEARDRRFDSTFEVRVGETRSIEITVQ